MRCETCGSLEAEHALPLIGDVCFSCYTRLEKPFTLEGLIESESIHDLAVKMDNEFLRRACTLRDKARKVIANAR